MPIQTPAAAGTGPVARHACASLPRQPGVYRFRDGQGRVLYLGRATDLRSRTRSYWGDLGDRRRLRRMVPQIVGVEAVVCASVHEAAWLERNLLERSKPRWNRAVGGEESPRWLVVDLGPARPAVRLTHDPEPGRPSFGPYLGGERSRTALRGILRVYPVHLTGEQSSGTERAIAEARGVGRGDRDRLVGEVLGLLSRDPAAADRIVARLVAAREEAVTDLRFESAQQIQDELLAVGWLVSPQRVTAPHPADLLVHGWSAGVLVSFTGSATRLDSWRIRRVGESRGRALAALTPPGWREFADTNAELAATLARVHRA